MPPRDFRQIFRMNKDSLEYLINRLSLHPVFNNNSRNRQQPVFVQILVALSQLGCNGNGASVGRISRMCGVGYGTVLLYTNRVIIAIISLEAQYITWPTYNERIASSRRFYDKSGIRCMGALDGTHINLCQRPKTDGQDYFTRKKVYSINCQLICDDRKRILWYQIGWPGSVADSDAYKCSTLYRQPGLFLGPGEVIIADSGYACKAPVCTPYKHPAAAVPDNKLFNELFSRARVCIEHVNGILKGRFMSLKGIRIQQKVLADFARINNWIKACLVLYNYLLVIGDEWTPMDGYELTEEEIEDRAELSATKTGNEFRSRLQEIALSWYDE